jgi:hypothetical protein
LFVVVDQLVRFRPLLIGGLAELLASSVAFTETHHRHAATVTAAGHATLITGTDPAHHGIIGNRWFDRGAGEVVGAVEDEHRDRSPHRLLVPALGDWLRERYPEAKVFAAGGKDRSAILLGGRRPDGAFWYDPETGRFTSSSYYFHRLPAWVEAWNAERPADLHLGTLWEPLPSTTEGLPGVGVQELDRGVFPDRFPHAYGPARAVPGEGFYEGLLASPVVDTLLLRFAQALVEAEGLGEDPVPDLLLLSFSALDTVGHAYGPDSPELADTLLRLDRTLGDLLRQMERRVGASAVAVVLSSDHGVAPLPEASRTRGDGAARRVTAPDVACAQRAGARLRRELGTGWALAEGYLGIAATGAERLQLERRLRQELAGCPGVVRVWTASDLVDGTRGDDPFLELYRRSFHAGRSPDWWIQYDPGFLPLAGSGTTHGSPYRFDTHVPWLLRWPGLAPGIVREPVATFDVAPTVAELLDVPLPGTIEGRSWVQALRRSSAPDPRSP